MPCCVATNQKPPNHKQHIQSSKVPDQIKCFVSIHFNDISFMVESCKDIPCLLICNFIELPVITSTLESLEQMIHILKYQLACSMTLCLWVIQFGELANLHAPSTKNQPFKNYRHLPIKMVAPLSKAFFLLMAIPTPWFPPPRGASPTCCPACARWDPPLEHVGNRGEKTGENRNKSYLDNPWRKVKEAHSRNGSCKRFPGGTSKWDIALCTLVSQPLLLGCAQASNYSKLVRLKVATV